MLVVMATYMVSNPCTRPLGPHFLTSHSPSSRSLSCSHVCWCCLQHVYSVCKYVHVCVCMCARVFVYVCVALSTTVLLMVVLDVYECV